MENTHRRPSGKRPKKRRFRGNQFMKVCSYTYVAERKDTSRLTDSLIDKLAHYYGNAIRCNSTSVKEMRKAIWAVWGHSCSTDDEPMHWFCPTNPNTWYLSHSALLKKCLGEKFGLKINRNVCVSLAERDNRRIFTSRQRRLESSFEARRAKKIKKSKEIELFQEKEAARGLLATDHVILNHGQVTWTTPELAPPLLTTPHQREDVSALDRFNVHRCPTQRVFSGTGLELETRQATI
ncbi:uncharacterized protein TNCV_4776631 [Trichonephila clavipes]|nr:uncharacterized protein TNCV_4776631 [Trichonephila clavipes]